MPTLLFYVIMYLILNRGDLMITGRPRLYNNVEDMQKDINNYFSHCDKKNIPYTMSGLAYALNMSRQSLINYFNKDEFFDTIKSARQKVEQQLEENALIGKANSVFTIFNLKNNFGWKDVIETKTDEETSKLDELLEAIKNDKKDK